MAGAGCSAAIRSKCGGTSSRLGGAIPTGGSRVRCCTAHAAPNANRPRCTAHAPFSPRTSFLYRALVPCLTTEFAQTRCDGGLYKLYLNGPPSFTDAHALNLPPPCVGQNSDKPKRLGEKEDQWKCPCKFIFAYVVQARKGQITPKRETLEPSRLRESECFGAGSCRSRAPFTIHYTH